MFFKKYGIYFICVAMICFSSCVGPKVEITKDTLYETPVPPVEYEYLLGPGDVIEIVYHNTPKPDKSEYLLAVGDIVLVEFTYHYEINREITIRPDGKVSLPRIGEIRAAGLSPSKFKDKLTVEYSRVFRDPEITVTMLQYNRAIEHLKTAITTAPRGQSKLTTIRPDGYISFPLLNDIKAAGKTLPQLKKITTEEYQQFIKNLSLTLILKEMHSNMVYVMGQVRNPNYYIMNGPTMVSQILSIAGGPIDSAELSSILVITRDKNNKPLGRIVNMRKIIEEGNIAHDVVLKQFDVVYIPKSKIARADQFVDQYINQIVPEFFKATLSGVYNFNDNDD